MNKKLLTTMLVLGAASLGVQAETFDTQILRATLAPFVDIKAETDIQTKTIDPETGNLDSGFSSIFTIRSNAETDLYLTAKADTQNGYEQAFFKKAGVVYVILTNTEKKPAGSALADIRTGTAIPSNNANAIAYPVSGVEIAGATTVEPQYNDGKNQYEFKVNPGVTTATTTISSSVDSTTYSFDDNAGTYEAHVTLTDTTT